MDALIQTVAQAIATAEGFGQANAAPTRYNNPGDLSKGDEWGQSVSGYVTLPDGENLIVFADANAGWNALYEKLQNILAGGSHTYSPNMTWSQIGQKWAGDWQNWVTNVTAVLGVSPNDTFANFFSGGGTPAAAPAASSHEIFPIFDPGSSDSGPTTATILLLAGGLILGGRWLLNL